MTAPTLSSLPLAPGILLGGGGASTDLVPSAFPVSIGGHPYLVDWQRYERQTVEIQRPAFDNQAEPGEQTLNPAAAWRRSQSRFDLGAGQAFFDDEQSDSFVGSRVGKLSSIRQRFASSKGLDPWDENGLRLLPAVTQLAPSTDTNLQMLVVDKYLYIVTDNDLTVIDVTGGSPGTVAAPRAITSITTDGTKVYVAYGVTDNVDTVDVGDMTPSLTAFGALIPQLVRYSNGRFIATERGGSPTRDVVWEYDNAGAHVGSALLDPDFGGTVADIVGTPVGIFVAHNVGVYRGELYLIAVDPDTGALLPARFSGRLPNGETFNSLYFYGGLIVAGTSLGIRVFELTGQDQQSTVMNPLIEIPGGVTAMAGLGEYVWFGWSDYDSASTGLGRMNVARTTDPDAIVPPYASDLMAGTTASPVQGDITSVAIIPAQGNRVVFAVSGDGFFGAVDDGELVASGTYDSGWVRMGTLADKAYSGVELTHDALDGEIQVELQAINATTPTTLGTSETPGSTSSEVFGTQVRTRAAKVLLTFTRDVGDDEAGPVLRSWTLSAFPAPARADEIIMPIVMREVVEGIDGNSYPQDLLAEYEYLSGLARSGQFVTLREYDLSEQVVVSQVLLPGDEDREGATIAAQDTRRWHQGPWLVRMFTKEA